MTIRDTVSLSLKALLINKGRSVLTMLGMIIGIASVILMISVGQAAQNYLLSQVASFGSNMVFITNGRGNETRSGPPSANQKQTLSVKDFQKIKSLPWVTEASVTIMLSDSVIYAGTEKRTMIMGSAPDEVKMFNIGMAGGRFFNSDDVESRSRVGVLGRDVAKKLFGEQDAIGQTLKVGKTTFRVIGVMQPMGTKFFTNMDDQIYVPYSAFMDVYGKDKFAYIAVQSDTIGPRESKDRLRIALRETHNLNNPSGDLSKDDFRVASQDDAIKNVGVIGSILQILLGSIASISLFVAGIGIMNIMYVTVTERTREIGLRKAIGAQERDILRQFLAEAIMLSFVAGVIGVIFGVGLSWLGIQIINQFQSGWTFVIPWDGVAIGFGVSAATGIVFGYFPARRAAQLNAIEALRFE